MCSSSLNLLSCLLCRAGLIISIGLEMIAIVFKNTETVYLFFKEIFPLELDLNTDQCFETLESKTHTVYKS